MFNGTLKIRFLYCYFSEMFNSENLLNCKPRNSIFWVKFCIEVWTLLKNGVKMVIFWRGIKLRRKLLVDKKH